MLLCVCAQSCPPLCNLMDWSSPGFLCLWDFPGKNIGAGCHFLLQGIFPTQGPQLQHCRWSPALQSKTQSLGKHSTHIISFNLHNNPTREAWNALGLWMRLREGQWNTSFSIIRWLTQQLSPCTFILNPCAILLLMVEQERQVVSWKEMESGDLLAEWVQLTYVFCGQTWVRCSVLSWTSADLILSHYINAVENPAITMWMATPKFGFL